MSKDELINISDFVHYFPLTEDKELKRNGWRKRNAMEILASGYTTGCTDRALVFMHFARNLGFPTVYVETIESEHLKDLKRGLLHQLEGHIFCDVEYKKEIVHINPGYGRTQVIGGSYIRKDFGGNNIRYEVLGKGTDYNKIFLRNSNGFESTPTSLKTTEEIRHAAQKVFGSRLKLY